MCCRGYRQAGAGRRHGLRCCCGWCGSGYAIRCRPRGRGRRLGAWRDKFPYSGGRRERILRRSVKSRLRLGERFGELLLQTFDDVEDAIAEERGSKEALVGHVCYHGAAEAVSDENCVGDSRPGHAVCGFLHDECEVRA